MGKKKCGKINFHINGIILSYQSLQFSRGLKIEGISSMRILEILLPECTRIFNSLISSAMSKGKNVILCIDLEVYHQGDVEHK